MILAGTRITMEDGTLKNVQDLIPGSDRVRTKCYPGSALVESVAVENLPTVNLYLVSSGVSGIGRSPCDCALKLCPDTEVIVADTACYPVERDYVRAKLLDQNRHKLINQDASGCESTSNFTSSKCPACNIDVYTITLSEVAEGCGSIQLNECMFIKVNVL